MSFIQTSEVVKEYSGTVALNKVSISVPRGTIYGLLGPNGAGKTTLIRILNQILMADSGTITFDGARLNASHIGRIGYLPEERGLYKKMKVGEQALYLAQLKGMSKHDASTRLKYWFDKFDIGSWWNRSIEELSKGMQQKVQFIVTVLHEPELLILDEPFSGFDPINANTIKQEIVSLKEKGITIILSTHNMASVEELCDSIALINKGKKLLEGTVSDIRRTYSTNSFEIRFSGWFDKLGSTLTPDYTIVSHRQEGDFTTINLTLNAPIATNDLIKHLMGLGNVVSFNEVLPSMNDVFINVVNGSHTSSNNN